MQSLFAQAILDPQALAPALANDRGGRFNVYRNNYLSTMQIALRTTFPTVERLLGSEFFAALAYAFAERHPPRSAIMARYGDALPGFLAQFAALADFPYLADVARLEYARVQAYHAADVVGFELDSEDAATAALDLPVRLHPSVSIIPSSYPFHSIWQAQFNEDESAQPDWRAETALVWRHGAFDTVEAMKIDEQELALITTLKNGGRLPALLADSTELQAATLLVTKFLELASAGILVPAPNIEQGHHP
jgi:hypothetical protein